MRRERFELALERIKPGDWEKFEEFASQYLACEFPSLRTLATPSGDRGRDSELFSPDGKPNIMLQYSVTENWSPKISQTVKRIKENFPDILLLIYVTNQSIGAKADDIKQKLLSVHNLILDIKDKSWFLDRMSSNDVREIVAERLAEVYVDTLLKDRNIIDQSSKILTNTETRAAYLYLKLQLEDEQKDKGLKKISYEAIIRSVLRETDSQNTIHREEIKSKVRNILSSQSENRVNDLVDSALNRMTKRIIRHWVAEDKFCLTHQESVRLSEELGKHENEQKELLHNIDFRVKKIAGDNYKYIETIAGQIVDRINRIIQNYLNSRGEKFASAITTGHIPGLATEDLKTIIIKDLSDDKIKPIKNVDIFSVIADTIIDLFQTPDQNLSIYLRAIADSYTLMAFLRETPDVQSSINKLLSQGEIWLDTNIVLPLFAEELLEESHKKFYTNILHVATEVGLKLKIIKGIIEEINGHLNRCIACARMPIHNWQGGIPFLFSLYVQSGMQTSQFINWVETFRGNLRSEDDIIQYIKEFYCIETSSLEEEAENFEVVYRGAVQEIWRESHEFRRERKGYEINDYVVGKLIKHDVENYLGVLQRRETEKSSPLGYSNWWLTLDTTAHMMESLLSKRIVEKPFPSPVMSLDFFANYLTFVPLRRRKVKEDFVLPIFIDRNISSYIPKELIEIANQIRNECNDIPEHVIRRRVRDELEASKRRTGIHVKGGTKMIKENIEKAFEDIPIED